MLLCGLVVPMTLLLVERPVLAFGMCSEAGAAEDLLKPEELVGSHRGEGQETRVHH